MAGRLDLKPLKREDKSSDPSGKRWIDQDTREEFDISNIQRYAVSFDPKTKTAQVYPSLAEVPAIPGHLPQFWWADPSVVDKNGVIKLDDRAGVGTIIVANGKTLKFEQPFYNTPDAVGVATVESESPAPKAAEPPPAPQPEPAPAPVAAAPQFPGTPIKAATMMELTAANFMNKVGNVELAKDPGGVNRSQFYQSMIDLRDSKLRAYFDAPAGSAAQKAATAEIVSSVNTMQDGYKQLALTYIKESMAQKTPLSIDDYTNAASTLFNSPQNKGEVMDFLKSKGAEVSRPSASLNAEPPKADISARPAVSQTPAAEPPAFDPQRMAIMFPPAQITKVSELNAAHNAATAALQQIKMTFRAETPGGERMSPAQIEDVISRHEKADPQFGSVLRQSYNDMKKLADLRNGPVDVFNNGVTSLRTALDKTLQENEATQALEQDRGRGRTHRVDRDAGASTNPGGSPAARFTEREAAMFIARPGAGAVQNGMAANMFVDFVARNPGMIGPELANKALASFDAANPKLGAEIHSIYTKLQSMPAATEADRKAREEYVKSFRHDQTNQNELRNSIREPLKQRAIERGMIPPEEKPRPQVERSEAARPQASVVEPSLMDRVKSGWDQLVDKLTPDSSGRNSPVVIGNNASVNVSAGDYEISAGRSIHISSETTGYNEEQATKYYRAAQAKEPGGYAEAFKGAADPGIRANLGLDNDKANTIVVNGPVTDKIQHNGNVVVNGDMAGGSIAATGDVTVISRPRM